MKIEREANRTFCKYCGEPLAAGRHAISEDIARGHNENCPKCSTDTMAVCMLGLGHFIYVCEKCGHRWSNIN